MKDEALREEFHRPYSFDLSPPDDNRMADSDQSSAHLDILLLYTVHITIENSIERILMCDYTDRMLSR